MSTARKSRKRVKPERRIRLIKPIRDGMGALQITIGGNPIYYLIYTLRSDFGVAFQLIKQELVPHDRRVLRTGRHRPLQRLPQRRVVFLRMCGIPAKEAQRRQ